jgi:hypothetical protein
MAMKPGMSVILVIAFTPAATPATRRRIRARIVVVVRRIPVVERLLQGDDGGGSIKSKFNEKRHVRAVCQGPGTARVFQNKELLHFNFNSGIRFCSVQTDRRDILSEIGES